MQMSDVIKRLSNCYKTEQSLRKQEEMLQKTTIKLYKSLNNAEAAIKNELTQNALNKRKLHVLKRTNKKLKLLVKHQDTSSKENLVLQAEYEALQRKREGERIRTCVKKECTRILLNPRCLPGAAQGMSVCHERWLPYTFQINNFDMKEVPLKFWSETQSQNNYLEQWKSLAFGGISFN